MHNKISKINIIGCGGHARSVADVILYNNPTIHICFIDEQAKKNETIWGFTCLTKPHDPNAHFITAIGDNKKRKHAFEAIERKKVISVISRLTHTSPYAHIDDGVFVGHYAHIGPEARIGKNTIINSGAIIEHETIIGVHCHIAPGATISGRTHVGNLVFVGSGATIIDKITICSNVIIGAGATVVKNITKSGTYVGTPAKKIGGL